MNQVDEQSVPEGWSVTTIGELAGKPQYGWTTSAKVGTGPKLLRTTDISSGSVDWRSVPSCEEPPPNLSKYRLNPGDIVVSRAGSVGLSFLVDASCPPDTIFASYLMRIRPGNDVDPRYLSYFMRSLLYWRQVEDASVGIGLANINASKLGAFKVLLPSRSVQHRIVQLLAAFEGKVTDASSHLKAARRAVERFRQAVLAAACSGRLTVDWREQYGNDQNMRTLLEDMRQSRKVAKRTVTFGVDEEKLEELPETWALAAIGEVAEVQVGGTPSRKEKSYWNGKIPWISSGEVANCRINTTRERITDDGLANSNAKIYPLGTVLIAMIGEGKTRGQSAILDINACTNQNVAAILPNRELLSSEYVWRWALAQYEITRAVGRGGNQPALNGQKVRELVIPLPPLDEQVEIVRQVDDLLSLADRLLDHIKIAQHRLTLSSQAVLAKAFRGELSAIASEEQNIELAV